MSGGCDRYKIICQGEFGAVHKKLDALDEAIRGNGKPGIQLRLDRLEEARRLRSRILWLVIGAVVTLAACTAWHRVFGG